MAVSAALLLCVLASLAVSTSAYISYPGSMPNGRRVKCPKSRPSVECDAQQGYCFGLGHLDCRGGGYKKASGEFLSPFGKDFLAVREWTEDFCSLDSDGDGLTNGEELGDPCCVWQPGQDVPSDASFVPSHPGDATDTTHSPQPNKLDCVALRGEAAQSNYSLSDSFFQEGEDRHTLEFQIVRHDLPAVETAYYDVFFDVPVNETYYITGFIPLIDNHVLVHHYVLNLCVAGYTAPQPLGVAVLSPSGDIIPECGQSIFAWAPGLDFQRLPSDVAFSVGKASQYGGTLWLQVHYNNPTLIPNATDSSRLQLFATTKARENNAAMLWTGGVVYTGTIPPHRPAFYSTSSCLVTLAPSCTNVTAYAAWPHEHLLGRAVIAEHFRRAGDGITGDTTKVGELGRDGAFNFENQRLELFPIRRVVREGDLIQTTCVYNSTERDAPTLGGLGSQAEMCVNFIHMFPAECVASFTCMGEPTNGDLPASFATNASSAELLTPIAVPLDLARALKERQLVCNLTLTRLAATPAQALALNGTELRAAWEPHWSRRCGGIAEAGPCTRSCAVYALNLAVCLATDLSKAYFGTAEVGVYTPPQFYVPATCNALVEKLFKRRPRRAATVGA